MPPSRSRSRAQCIARRRFLAGAGGVALGLPWLEQLDSPAAAAPAAAGPKRVIVVTYQMGVPGGVWRPSAAGSSFTLPFVTEPLEPFRDRLLFVSSIDHAVLEAGGNAFVFGHPAKTESALTGTLTTGAFPTVNQNRLDELLAAPETTGGANGPSIEHVIGPVLRNGQSLTSVDLGVDGDAIERQPAPTMASRFFFESAGNPVSVALRPNEAFDQLFASLPTGGEEADLELRKLRFRNKSVLDAVRAGFNDLKQGLGAADRMRLEEHAARIRSIEIDPTITAACTAPSGIDAGPYSGLRMDQISPLQVRILAHAMACDLAPVGRLEFTNQQNPRFGVTELDDLLDSLRGTSDWHAIVHGDPLPGTDAAAYLRPGRDDVVTAYDARLQAGYRFFLEQFASLLSELDAVAEGPGTTVLDNSLVILASDLGEGLGHGMAKMGYILAGNLGGARVGYHFDAGPDRAFEVSGSYFYAASRYNVSQLLNSILDMAGVADAQGGPASIGLGGWLESEGLPRRIDGLFA